MKNARTVLVTALLLAAASASAQLDHKLSLPPRDTLPKDTVIVNGNYILVPADLGFATKLEGMTWIETTAQYLIRTDTLEARNWMIEHDKGMNWYKVSTVAEVGPDLIQYLAQYPGLERVWKTRRYSITIQVGKMYNDKSWEIIHNALTEFYNQ